MAKLLSDGFVRRLREIDAWYRQQKNIRRPYRRNKPYDNAFGALRKAYCKTDAGSGQTLVCYLDTDATGTEITVNFSLATGENMEDIFPDLTNGDLIFVQQFGSDWWCVQIIGHSGTGDIHKAFAKAAAGAGTTLTCFLDTDTTGDEITVNFSISGPTNTLSDASPNLIDGDMIFVRKFGSDWYCIQTFQTWDKC